MDAINNSTGFSKPDTKAAILKQLQQEAAMANASQLISKLNNRCFEKCVPSPGSSFSSKEESCFTQCMEKYIQTWNTVSRQYIDRLQKAQGGGDNFLA